MITNHSDYEEPASLHQAAQGHDSSMIDYSNKIDVSDKDFREKLVLEDVKKIHGEINQYINHSYLLTAAAIAAFGVGVGWIVSGLSKPDSSRPGSEVDIALFSSSLMTILIALFFVGSQLIENNLTLVVTYLREKNWSDWEWDMHKLRNGQGSLPYCEESYFRRGTMWALVAMTPFIPVVAVIWSKNGPTPWVVIVHVALCPIVWVILGIVVCNCGAARKNLLTHMRRQMKIERKDIPPPEDWPVYEGTIDFLAKRLERNGWLRRLIFGSKSP